jgi:hypothetical protein
MKRLLITLFVLFLFGCPPTTNPYIAAKTVISSAQTAVSVADSIFENWVTSQPDKTVVESQRRRYAQLRLAVVQGLEVAYQSVNVAEELKAGMDVPVILQKADTAWSALRLFINEVFVKYPANIPLLNETKTGDGGAKIKTYTYDGPLKLLPISLIK